MLSNEMTPVEVENVIYQTLQRIGYRHEQWDVLIGRETKGTPAWPGEFAELRERELAALIDHTILKADATDADVAKVSAEAREWQFASVCVNSCHVGAVSRLLEGSGVVTCGVVGFPLGAMATIAKAKETWSICQDGGQEVDMVMNVGKLKSGDYQYVLDDVGAVVEAAEDRPVKVILETGFLSEDEIVCSCVLAVVAGATFVKTSTGFGPGGAREAHIGLMRRVVGVRRGVKASGGIKDAAAALRMVRAGANRIGTSSGLLIVGGSTQAGTY